MTDTPARLLTLLSLLQTPREWPGGELADRLGVSLRTVRRDVERLRDLGYPVRATMGAAGGYRLVAGTAMPPLLLDDDEAVAIAVGLRAAAGQAISGIDEASVRALGKLDQVLPNRLRHRIRSLDAATVPLPSTGPSVDPAALTLLAGAIANREAVRFAYRTADGAAGERRAEPHRLVAAAHRWYLVAYDTDRADWRIFRVDRITGARRTGVRVAPRELPATDAAAFVTGKMYGLRPTYAADVTLHASADEIVGRAGTTLGEPERLAADRCRIRTPPDTLDWLAMRLLLLGCEFEVHGPPELVETLRGYADRIGRATAGH
ncbi:MAG TPA: YafY family protein [Actinocatenispora sp.]